jgi:hypothetical protein
MNKISSSFRRATRLSAIALVAIVLNASAASAQSPLDFAVLAGTAVTCTGSLVIGDVGVWPSGVVNNTGCFFAGTVHKDAVSTTAFLNFLGVYLSVNLNPPACDETLSGTLAGQTIAPGVYCVEVGPAKTGLLTLDGQNIPGATWVFLMKNGQYVNGALTGTNFNVLMSNGGLASNVWWVAGSATMTDSTFVGSMLAGGTITVTRGSFHGDAWATAAVVLDATILKGR